MFKQWVSRILFNLVFKFNYSCIEDEELKEVRVRCFLDGIKAEGWKFNSTLRQVYDDLYVTNKTSYDKLLNQIQSSCK